MQYLQIIWQSTCQLTSTSICLITQTNSNMKNSMVNFLLLLFSTRGILFQEFRSKKSNLFVEAAIQNVDQFKYVEFNSVFAFFLFQIRNAIFGLIWSKNSKLSHYPEIQCLDYFECAKFNGDVPFFCFKPYFATFVQKSYLTF